jgi:biotin carboxylase
VRRVILLGARPGAARAARRLGFEVAVEPGGARPDAIVALRERHVVPAARAREALGVPGLGLLAALRATDKAMMKDAARRAGVPCADFEPLMPGGSLRGVAHRLGLPLILKRREGSGGRGSLVLEDPERAPWVPPNYLAERLVEGREMSVESVVAGGQILFTNATEYFVPRHANILPAPFDVAAALDLNAHVIAALGITRGFTHCEILLTSRGPVFGEIAVRPPGGRIMRLLKRAYGFDPWEALLRVELGEVPTLNARAKRCAGAWVLHPGPGRVREVVGVEGARAVPGVTGVKVRVGPGDVIRPREGTGQDVGWIEADGPTRDDVARALQAANDRVRIVLG